MMIPVKSDNNEKISQNGQTLQSPNFMVEAGTFSIENKKQKTSHDFKNVTFNINNPSGADSIQQIGL